MLIKELWVEANWRNGFRDEKKEAEREETRGPGPRRERPAAGGTTVHEPGKLGPSPRGAGRQGRAAAGDALPLWVGEESATGGLAAVWTGGRGRRQAPGWTQGCLIAARPDDIVLVSKQEKRRKRRKRHVFKSTPVSSSKPLLTRATYLPPEQPQR